MKKIKIKKKGNLKNENMEQNNFVKNENLSQKIIR